MGNSRLFLVRVWARAHDFRAVVRSVDEDASHLFTAPQALADYLHGLPPVGAARMEAEPALTSREREVALLCDQGLPDKQIARRLDLSPATVRNHISHCYRKLGVNNRVALGRVLRDRLSIQSGGDGAFAPSQPAGALPSIDACRAAQTA
jgi:DNA-binding CsgD family transcriptional regulator